MWIVVAAWISAALVFAAFFMKTMLPLRVVAIASNMGFIVYALLGLVIFGAYSIFDFNRLKRADMSQAIPIAASIFLDIFNVLLLFLSLFGGGGRN